MRTAAAVLVAVVLLASCGREGEQTVSLPTPTASAASASPDTTDAPSSPPPSSPSGSPGATATPAATSSEAKTAFVNSANALCREFTQRLEDLERPEDIDDLPPWLRGFVSIMDDLNRRFRELTPPAADAQEVEEYLDGNDAQRKALADALPEIDAAAETNDAERADAALDKAFTIFDRIAREQDPWARGYGLRDCVEPDPNSNTVA